MNNLNYLTLSPEEQYLYRRDFITNARKDFKSYWDSIFKHLLDCSKKIGAREHVDLYQVVIDKDNMHPYIHKAFLDDSFYLENPFGRRVKHLLESFNYVGANALSAIELNLFDQSAGSDRQFFALDLNTSFFSDKDYLILVELLSNFDKDVKNKYHSNILLKVFPEDIRSNLLNTYYIFLNREIKELEVALNPLFMRIERDIESLFNFYHDVDSDQTKEHIIWHEILINKEINKQKALVNF